MSLVTSSIASLDDTGVNTEDGQHHDFDVIVAATGFDVSHRPPWPVIGRHGIRLDEQWKDEPLAYLSIAATNFPNMFHLAGAYIFRGVGFSRTDLREGPNSPVGHGSLMSQLQWTADYICQWITKMAEEDIKQV